MKIVPITWTVNRAATEFGFDRERLRHLLTQAEQVPDARGRFTTRQIARSIFGDAERERFKRTRAQARLAEIEVQRAQRELLPAADVRRAWSYAILQCRARWLQLPARAALAFQQWSDAKGCEAWLDAEARSLLEEFASSPSYNPPDETEPEEPPREN